MEIEHGLPKARIKPKSNYVPWENDQEFSTAWNTIADLTMVDRMRGYELWQLVRQLDNVPGDIIEVGVWKGGTGLMLAQALLLRTPCDVFLCDTFQGIVNASDRDPRFRGGELADCSASEVRERAAALSLENVIVLEGTFPEETGSRVESRQLRFGHIDVDVYVSAKRSFNAIWKCLSPGGVVVFDDYGFVDCAGVTNFVNEEIVGRSDALMIHNLNGHAIVVKTGGP